MELEQNVLKKNNFQTYRTVRDYSHGQKVREIQITQIRLTISYIFSAFFSGNFRDCDGGKRRASQSCLVKTHKRRWQSVFPTATLEFNSILKASSSNSLQFCFMSWYWHTHMCQLFHTQLAIKLQIAILI